MVRHVMSFKYEPWIESILQDVFRPMPSFRPGGGNALVATGAFRSFGNRSTQGEMWNRDALHSWNSHVEPCRSQRFQLWIFLCLKFHVQLWRVYRHGFGNGQGVLLYGPPGTGKTLTARAVANREVLRMAPWRVRWQLQMATGYFWQPPSPRRLAILIDSMRIA